MFDHYFDTETRKELKNRVLLEGLATVFHSTSPRAFESMMEERYLHPPSVSESARRNKNPVVGSECSFVFLNIFPFPHLSNWGQLHLFIDPEFIKKHTSKFFTHFDRRICLPTEDLRAMEVILRRLGIEGLPEDLSGCYRPAFMQLVFEGSIPMQAIALVVVDDDVGEQEILRTSIPTVRESYYKEL